MQDKSINVDSANVAIKSFKLQPWNLIADAIDEDILINVEEIFQSQIGVKIWNNIVNLSHYELFKNT